MYEEPDQKKRTMSNIPMHPELRVQFMYPSDVFVCCIYDYKNKYLCCGKKKEKKKKKKKKRSLKRILKEKGRKSHC